MSKRASPSERPLAQWWSICITFAMPWFGSPVLRKTKQNHHELEPKHQVCAMLWHNTKLSGDNPDIVLDPM